jgi:hypothetical protein
LGIEKLLDVVVLKIAYALVGKDREEIRIILDLPEMTNAEREQAQRTTLGSSRKTNTKAAVVLYYYY